MRYEARFVSLASQGAIGSLRFETEINDSGVYLPVSDPRTLPADNCPGE